VDLAIAGSREKLIGVGVILIVRRFNFGMEMTCIVAASKPAATPMPLPRLRITG